MTNAAYPDLIRYSRSHVGLYRGGSCTMKKPSKTAAELEASIKVEMEDICEWPTDLGISVQPDGDSWKVKVLQEGSQDGDAVTEAPEDTRPAPRIHQLGATGFQKCE